MIEFPLFEEFPELAEVPRIALGKFPTRVHSLENIGEELGVENLWIKRDDESSTLYGGNKVRKLEFLLADVKARGANVVITGGGIGSNYCPAVTIYCSHLGLKTVLVLFDQPLTEAVRRNLLLDCYFGAEVYYAGSYFRSATKAIKLIATHKIKSGGKSHFLIPGGSTPLGTLGYVNAAFELKEQIENGEMPAPDYIFVTLGSCGTMAGLLAGASMCDLRTKIVGVQVADRIVCNRARTARIANKVLSFIASFSKIKEIRIKKEDVEVLCDYFGGRYGLYTERGLEAMRLMKEREGIQLDGTYTAKTFAALIDFVRDKQNKDKVILFWNTYNSVNFDEVLRNCDYRKLPENLWKFFQQNL
jgi:D-cysteine desulfhydrase